MIIPLHEWLINRSVTADGTPRPIAEIIRDYDPKRVIGVIRDETGKVLKKITPTTYSRNGTDH